jgi:RND family efflux transporter MFP subunit
MQTRAHVAEQLTNDLESLTIPREPLAPPMGREHAPSAKHWRWVPLAIFGLATVTLGFNALHVGELLFKTSVATTRIETVAGSAGPQVALTSTGYVTPASLVKIGAKLTGRVQKIAVKEGDRVEAGQLLAQIDDADQKSALATAKLRALAAEARAQAARANFGEARAQASRDRKLAERGVVAVAIAADKESRAQALAETLKAADAEVRAAQAEAASLALNQQHMTITAPSAGTVIAARAVVGELVGPQTGALVELAAESALVVETTVPEGKLTRVQVGAPCEIQLDAFAGKRWRGRATQIGSRVNRAQASVTVKVEFVDAPDGVLADMSARVSFLDGEPKANAEPARVIVPRTAVTERDGAKVVFVNAGGTVRMARVVLGAQYGDGFELKEGPPAGTRVVKDPPAELADGQRVKERSDS